MFDIIINNQPRLKSDHIVMLNTISSFVMIQHDIITDTLTY